ADKLTQLFAQRVDSSLEVTNRFRFLLFVELESEVGQVGGQARGCSTARTTTRFASDRGVLDSSPIAGHPGITVDGIKLAPALGGSDPWSECYSEHDDIASVGITRASSTVAATKKPRGRNGGALISGSLGIISVEIAAPCVPLSS